MRNPINAKIISVFLVPFFLCCADQNKSYFVVGKYKSKKYNIFEKGLMALNRQRYILNSELNLVEDSTYQLSTCGNLINGHWRISKDSLYLFCEQNVFKKESLYKKATPSCSEKPTVFYINSDTKKIKLIGLKKLEGKFAVYNFVKQ